MSNLTEEKSINIPIKSIVEESMKKNGAHYPEEFIMCLRRFFIATLNLGWIKIEPQVNDSKELENCVAHFTSKISSIEYYTMHAGKKEKGYYLEKNKDGKIKLCFYRQEPLSEKIDLVSLAAFRSIFEVVSGLLLKEDDAFKLALIELAAYKVYLMDTTDERIVMPKETEYSIGSDSIILRAGYRDAFNLEISLLKQLLIACSINENVFVRSLLTKEDVTDFLDKEFYSKLTIIQNLLEILDIIYCLEKTEKDDALEKKEIQLIENYQRILNEEIIKKEEINENHMEYLAFCALITNDELRKELKSKKY